MRGVIVGEAFSTSIDSVVAAPSEYNGLPQCQLCYGRPVRPMIGFMLSVPVHPQSQLSRDVFVVQRGQAPQAGVTIVHVSSCDMDEHGDRLSGNRYAALSDDAHGEVQDGRGSPQSMKRPPAFGACFTARNS